MSDAQSLNDEAVQFLTRRQILREKFEALGNDDAGFNLRRDINDLENHIFMQLNAGCIRAYELERRVNQYIQAKQKGKA